MGPFDAPLNDDRAMFEGLLLATERPGIRDLLKWLDEETDFYTAPASTRHHGAVEGGLLAHSLAVYDWLSKLHVEMPSMVSGDTLTIVALLHDLCKVNVYALEKKSLPRKDEQGNLVLDKYGKKIWDDTLVYTWDDKLPIVGHGARSVIMAQRFIRLTVEETMGIGWHMGAWDTTDYNQRISLGQAMQIYPLCLAVQMADMAATYWEGK